MGNFSHIIDGMTWSYSRLSAFDTCRYAWASLYLYGEDQRKLFFSDFGSYIHNLLRRYFAEEIEYDDLPDTYLSDFSKNVSGAVPSLQIISSRMEDGLSYFRSPFSGLKEMKQRRIVGIEQEFDCDIDGLPFVGIIDLESFDGDELVITDHKSSVIKPPSGRKKPTKYDIDRKEKSRQLYLYAPAVKAKFGRWPDRLEFNCYRVPEVISIPFDEHEKDDAVKWALAKSKEISECDDFTPNIDFFHCKYLCHLAQCPYRDML